MGNLPNRLTSFVGRDRELEMLERLLAESALVTLTGPGGAGKTRLAIETARRRAGSFADGAWLVRLEGIEDPELVLDAIAGTFGLVESPQTTPIERLQAFLADRSILLVLDNFEHLMPAAAHIHALLERAGPDVRIVVTQSGTPLRIGPEQDVSNRPSRPFRRHRPLRGARPARRPVLRADGREPRRRRRDLRSPRWAAAWDRARSLTDRAAPRGLDRG